MPETKAISLYSINVKFYNDINIRKFTSIYHTNLKHLCVSYKNIETGLTVYLFNIYNINKLNDKTQFNIYAFSYCYIKKSMIFNLYFNDVKAYCFFDHSNNLNVNKYLTNQLIANCTINSIIDNLNDFYFPKAQTENEDIQVKISNYRKHIRIIFKDFYCLKYNNCTLKALFYKNAIKGYFLKIKINNNIYFCKLNEEVKFINIDKFPIERDLKCQVSLKKKISKINISGIPINMWISENRNNNITNIFIISRIILEEVIQNQVILIGKLVRNLGYELKNLNINYFYPKFTLICHLAPSSKEIQSYIYCQNDKKINSEILLENQVVYSENNELLLLINEETFTEIDSKIFTEFKSEYSGFDLNNIYSKNNYNKNSFYDYFNSFFLILLSFIKFYFSLPLKMQRIRIKLKMFCQ